MKLYYAKHGNRLREIERQRRLSNPELAKLNDRKSYQRNRLKKLAAKKDYYVINREKKNAYDRSYHIANKDNLSTKHRLWYLKNRQNVIAKNATYARAHPQAHKLSQYKWRKRHPEKWQAKEARRRALENGAVTDKESVQWFFSIIRNQDFVTCSYCSQRIDALKAHVDHIVPLSCGGDDLPDNFAVSCPSCNLSKHNHLLHEWKRCPPRIKKLWLEFFQKNI